MRHLKQVSHLFRIVEAKPVCHGSDHEHLAGDRIICSKLVMKEGKKPDKFLLPHGIPSNEEIIRILGIRLRRDTS
jgi:hypothetical protein